MDDLKNRYQLPEDVAPAGESAEESDLLDLATGVLLIDGDTQDILTGETLETIVVAKDGNCLPVLIANDEDNPAVVNIANQKQSEVDTSLLGVPKSETALVLFDAVNIYGVNGKEWSSTGFYTYFQDPEDYTFDGDFGRYTRHLPFESAIQAYVFPKPQSFVYPVDDNSGRFPGGYTNGVMTASWESKRAFRYQPGRVSGFTLGVRMSSQSGDDGEVIQWGCRNGYGDGYFFQLEKGTDLYIVRTSPDLGTLKVPREEWNGDGLVIGEGITGWGLDLSRVTMFKIEFSWYGAVGAKFLAYVPAGVGDARWVTLHYVSAENRFETPSLRSAYLRLFTSVRAIAGATQPTFINLYGSSVYIDGGDKGTVTTGAATMDAPKNIDATPRSMLGLQVKGRINEVDSQKAVYPVSFAAFASTPTRFDLIFKSNGTCNGVQYGYGPGTSISRGLSATIAGTVTGGNQFTIASGTFPNIAAEMSGSTDYLSGKRVRITGANVFSTHAIAINSGLTEITTDRALPAGLSSVRLARLDAYAVASGVTIASGVTEGAIYRNDDAGYWRLGLWPQASGVYNGTQPVVWFASSYSALSFDKNGITTGERRLPFGCNAATSFTIATDSGAPSYTLSAGRNSLTVSGTVNPWPVTVVAELMDGATISDITVFERNNINIVGSGATKAVVAFTTSGVSQTAPAGGTSYVAHKFEDSLADPLSAVMVDRQGIKAIAGDSRVATYFIGSGETKQFDLSNVFGPDKMYITGAPGTLLNSGGLFVMATARTGSGIASAMLNWEEQ